MGRVKFSVITVCFNAEKNIKYTIESILSQDYTDFEYLIMDGESSDSTVDIASGYRGDFEKKGISYSVFSEKDMGIYDAMNKALDKAQGDWIIYINAGDALFHEHVLSRSLSELKDEYDAIYGDAVLMERGKYKLLKARDVKEFIHTNPVCHQASMVRADVMRSLKFDLGFEIAADYDLFLRIYMGNPGKLHRVNMPVSLYLFDGISNTKIYQREKEFDLSRKKNGLKRVAFPFMQIIKDVLIYKIRAVAISVMGDGFYVNKRGWYLDKYEAIKHV